MACASLSRSKESLGLLALVVAFSGPAVFGAFPDAAQLPSHPGLPDPLVMLDGHRVADKGEWTGKRRPELKALFQHYMYGEMPPAPEKVRATVARADGRYFGGKATKTEVAIDFGP